MPRRPSPAIPVAPRRPRERTAQPPPTYRPGPPIDSEEALGRALAALHRADPVTVAHLVAVGGTPPLRRREPGFAGLAAIITSQQLSTSSAGAIFGRLEEQVAPLTPERLLAASDAVLRGLGLSLGKIATLRAVATAIAEQRLTLAGLADIDAEQAHATLVGIKGVGPWTADSFLLFCLGHPDAFPSGDLALQEAARIALRLDGRPSAAALAELGERWRPNRGVAARLLWAYYRVIKQGRSGMTLASP